MLVDTSVWIRFISGREPFGKKLDRLLADDDVAGHEMVYGELLLGDTGGRAKLLTAYMQMQQARTIPHAEVTELVCARRLSARGVGWVDVHLIASAVVGRYAIWTADPRFAAVVNELGLAHSFGA